MLVSFLDPSCRVLPKSKSLSVKELRAVVQVAYELVQVEARRLQLIDHILLAVFAD